MPSSAAVLCAAVVLAVASPAAAHAQFGRLRGLGAAATRGAVDKTVDKAVDRRAQVEAGEARPSAVAFTGDVLEITEARLEQLVRGLDAELAARPAAERRYQTELAAAREAERSYPARLAAYEREYAAWAERKAALEACAARVQDAHAGEVAATRTAAEAAGARAQAHFTPDRQAQLKAMGDRMRAAQARGDRATVLALTDSLQRAMRNEILPMAHTGMALADRAEADGRAMRRETQACGTLPGEPARPASATTPDAAAAGAAVTRAGQAASGLTARQYDVLRERAEEFVRRGGRTGASSYRYTAGELGALGGRLAALRAHGTFAGEGSWSPGGA